MSLLDKSLGKLQPQSLEPLQYFINTNLIFVVEVIKA